MTHSATLHALSREVDVPLDHALRAMSGRAGYAWIREGDAYVGWGSAATPGVGTGSDRFDEAARSAALLDRIDLIGPPEGAPAAFTSFTFDAATAGSSFVVPATLLRATDLRSFLTVTGTDRDGLDDEWERSLAALERTADTSPQDAIRYAGASNNEVHWLEAVAEASRRMEDGLLKKVVLARDVRVWSRMDFDLWTLARRLVQRFPSCFTYVFEGLVGASPELLIRRTGRQVESVVLAGSAPRGADKAHDRRSAEILASSPKERVEHELAVTSVAEPLREMCVSLDVRGPEVLRLDNIQHLATRVSGRLRNSQSVLELAGRLHPTAAVAGAPRQAALELIATLEKLDRGRYAGAVGVVKPSGDGELAIALRCGEFNGARGRLFAGAGIVAGSRPEAELEETRLKLRAMEAVLEGEADVSLG